LEIRLVFSTIDLLATVEIHPFFWSIFWGAGHIRNQVDNLAREMVGLRNQLQRASKDRDDALTIQAMQKEKIRAIRQSKLYRFCRNLTGFAKEQK
jgi:hypothetical protein